MRNAGAVWLVGALAACSFNTGSDNETNGTLGTVSTTAPPATTSGADESSETGEPDDGSESSTTRDGESSSSGVPETTTSTGEVPDFLYRRRLTFVAPPGSAIEDVIVRVSLDSSRMTFSNAQPDGSDIVFLADDLGSAFAYDVERYDSATGDAEIWVRVPRVGGSAIGFWMYYGATGSVTPPDAQAVWAQRFSAVLHMDDVADSTAAAAHGTDQGTVPALGWIGAARSFAGAVYVDLVPNGLSSTNGGVSFWFKRAAAEVASPEIMFFASRVATSAGFTGNDVHVHIGSFGDETGATVHVGSASGVGGGAFADGGWHHAVATWQGEAAARLYIDGEVNAQGEPFGPAVDFTAVARLGGPAIGTDTLFSGELDEVRLLAQAPPLAWIQLDHRSQADQLLQFGAEEPG